MLFHLCVLHYRQIIELTDVKKLQEQKQRTQLDALIMDEKNEPDICLEEVGNTNYYKLQVHTNTNFIKIALPKDPFSCKKRNISCAYLHTMAADSKSLKMYLYEFYMDFCSLLVLFLMIFMEKINNYVGLGQVFYSTNL